MSRNALGDGVLEYKGRDEMVEGKGVRLMEVGSKLHYKTMEHDESEDKLRKINIRLGGPLRMNS